MRDVPERCGDVPDAQSSKELKGVIELGTYFLRTSETRPNARPGEMEMRR